MKRIGFTMIELVFVIVILGILATVAIPKLTATQKSAKAEVVEAFVGTMNRTTLPSMYAKAIRTDGSIKDGTFKVADYISIPKEVGTVDLTKCAIPLTANNKVATTKIGIAIYCRDGNDTNPPVFSFSSSDVNTTLPDLYYK